MSEPEALDKDILQDFPLALTPDQVSQTSNLVEDFRRFRDAPLESVRTLLKHLTGSSWRSYDNYIGQQLYTPGGTEFFKQQTLANPALQEKINMLALAQLDLELPLPKEEPTSKKDRRIHEKLHKARAERYTQLQQWLNDMSNRMVDEMTSTFDHKSVLRFMYYIVAQIFSRTYHQGVHVNMAQVERLRTKAAELQKKNQSLIFLPCHKSHIDYMSIQFICFRIGISLPSVVAGDNLNFAVIGPLIRQCGALFIRRSFGNDKLYNATMQAFVEMLLSHGYNMECFIEGTRSRTGKLLPPKYGFIKFIIESILSGRVEDTWIAPISTQYDKVAEAESYATELLGKEKQSENFSQFWSARKILALNMGRVDVRFHEPWSLREFITTQISRDLARSALSSESIMAKTDTSLLNSHILTTIANDAKIFTPEMRVKLLRSFGYRVLSDINAASVVMPTSLIGTMLLTNRGRGISKNNLVRRVRWLIALIKLHGGHIGEFSQPSIEALVDNGLKVLGPDLVGVEAKGLLQTTYYAKDPFKLSYYRNQIIHLFVTEAIVAVAIYSKVLNTPNSEDYITYSDLLGRVTFISRVLSGEFVFGPEGIQTNLSHTLKALADQDVVVLDKQDDPLHPTHKETIIRISPKEVSQGRENFDFYCFFVWPFVDGFWLTLVALFSLTPTLEQTAEYYAQKPRSTPPSRGDIPLLWVEERTFLNAAQVLGKTLYHQGTITYYEAVNKEMLKNALLQYVAEGIVLQRRADNKPTMYALHPSWLPTRYSPERPESVLSQSPATGVSTYVDLDDDPHMVHALHRGDIVPQGKLYDFEESVAYTRRLLRLRRDTPSLSVPILRLASALFDGSAPEEGGVAAAAVLLLHSKQRRKKKQGGVIAELVDGISSTFGSAEAPAVIQSLNEASRPENDNTSVKVSRPSKVAYAAKL